MRREDWYDRTHDRCTTPAYTVSDKQMWVPYHADHSAGMRAKPLPVALTAPKPAAAAPKPAALPAAAAALLAARESVAPVRRSQRVAMRT